MRHGKKFNHLGRKAAHRKALLRNLSIALIEHKRIETTLAKAKALRKFIEPLVTKGKTNTMHSRRVVFSYLQNKEAVKEIFGAIAEKVGDRPGGYVRVIKTGFRRSDGAEMAMIEFVDFNEVYSLKDAKKPSRRRRSKKKSTNIDVDTTATTEAAVEETTEETPAAEEVVEVVEEVVEETPVAEEAAEEAPAAEEPASEEESTEENKEDEAK
jgi:large subunit ribosomal protein L17